MRGLARIFGYLFEPPPEQAGMYRAKIDWETGEITLGSEPDADAKKAVKKADAEEAPAEEKPAKKPAAKKTAKKTDAE